RLCERKRLFRRASLRSRALSWVDMLCRMGGLSAERREKGINFTGTLKALAMQHGRRTCTLEAPLLLGTRVDGKPETKSISDQVIGEMLHELEVRMKKNVGLDARMHHAQRNW